MSDLAGRRPPRATLPGTSRSANRNGFAGGQDGIWVQDDGARAGARRFAALALILPLQCCRAAEEKAAVGDVCDGNAANVAEDAAHAGLDRSQGHSRSRRAGTARRRPRHHSSGYIGQRAEPLRTNSGGAREHPRPRSDRSLRQPRCDRVQPGAGRQRANAARLLTSLGVVGPAAISYGGLRVCQEDQSCWGRTAACTSWSCSNGLPA